MNFINLKNFKLILISVLLLMVMPTEATKWTGIKISLDPAYGGSDYGPLKSGHSVPAKDLTLWCALDMKTKLEAAGAEVVLTRSTDIDMTATERRDAIGAINPAPKAHVSIHLNGSDDGKGNGTDTYYHTNYKDISKLLRDKLQIRLLAKLGLEERFNTDELWIVLNNPVPSAMTFGLFYDYPSEYNMIKTRYSAGYNNWVDAHLLGIWDYLKSNGYDSLDDPTKPYLTEKWNQSVQKGNSIANNWDATKVRNMAYANGKLYMTYDGSGIRVVKSQSGALLYDLDNNTNIIVGGYPRLSDVAYFDGKVVACNIGTGTETSPLKVYVWDSDVSEPRVVLETTNLGGVTRLGDVISCSGSWNDGYLNFARDQDSKTRIIRYKITNGTVAITPTVIEVKKTGAYYPCGSSVRVISDTGGFWINGSQNQLARLNTSGEWQYEMPQSNAYGNGFAAFVFQGKQYALATASLDGAKKGMMQLYDATPGWKEATVIENYPSAGLGDVTNGNATGACYVRNNDEYIESWVLSGQQGAAYYTLGTPPTPTYSTPHIYLGPGDLFLSAPVKQSRNCTFTVTGDYLTDNITVSSNNSAVSVSTSNIAKTNYARTVEVVTLTFTPTEAKKYTATITLSSAGATSRTFTFTGYGHTEEASLSTKYSNFNFKTSEWNNGNHVRAADVYNGHLYVKHRANRAVYQINPQNGNIVNTYTYNGQYSRWFPEHTDPGTADKNYCWAGWSISMGTDGSLFASGNHGDYVGYAFGATKNGETYKQIYKSGLADLDYLGRIDYFSLYGTTTNGYLAAATVAGKHGSTSDNNDVICIWKIENGITTDNVSINHIGKRNAHLSTKISDDAHAATGADICWIDQHTIFVTGEYTYPIIYNISNTTNTSTKINMPTTTTTGGGGAYFKIGDIPYIAIPNNRRGSVSIYDISNPASPKAVATTENMSSENNPVLHYSIIADVGTGDNRDVATIYVWAPNCGYGVYEFTVPHIWSGNTNTTWGTNNNWKYKVEPTSTRDVLIPAVSNNKYPILTNSIIINSVEIAAGASLDLSNKFITVEAEGITNAGTLKTQGYLPNNVSSYGGTVEYYGTGNQTIHAATYTDLNLYKAGIFTLPTTNNLEAVNVRLNASSNLEVDAGQSVKVSSTLTNPGKADGILIKAEAGKANASLVFHNAQNNPVEATVQMYSKAYWVTKPANQQERHWQYFGIPFREFDDLHDTFGGAYIRRYNEAGTGTAASIPLSQRRWIQLQNSDKLDPIKGYEIVQANEKLYTFSGVLYNDAINYTLTYTPTGEYPGQHILSNPYTAAINIKDISFGANVEATVYQYNTGSWHEWSDGKGEKDINAPGQYISSTQANAGSAGIPGQIPSMQGFLVKTNGASTISIPYSSTEKNTEIQRTAAQPTPWLRLSLSDENGPCDIMWLFQYIHATPGFDNGRDARKLIANNELALLYSRNETGDYQINTQADIHNTDIAFKASSKTNKYSITFHHGDGMTEQYDNIYLKDKLLSLLIDITEDGTTYSFSSSNTTATNRFKILTSKDGKDITEGTTDVCVYTKGRQLVIENHGKEDSRIELYDSVGRLVASFHCPANSTLNEYLTIGSGSYIARIMNVDGSRVVSKKIMING